jgi:hypothetical protein
MLATPEELLAGAMRYAAERVGQDPKFTKNPATWLNKGSYADEPAQPIGNVIDQNGNPSTAVALSAPPPNRPPPPRGKESNFERMMRKHQQGGA